ncbi:MAG TPA: carboxypeptidase-like regulatory domain-containing protein, partial [Thermoanaerobaculia bacterium]|nr:carboxypeptidase-like regulatory domain-containing protein [Thermoanaerobaculia bacterium]
MEEVQLRLFPMGRIRGKLIRPDAGALPASVTVGVQSTASQPGKGDALDATIPCPVHEERLDCAVPAGRVDLRLRAEGFTPLYLWDLTLPARESKDLGTLRLQRGASVVGWVQEEDGRPASGVRVELAPHHVGSSLSIVVSRELERMKLEGKSNEKGFFQLTGVSPGRYVLTASKEGFAPVRVQPVDVRPDLEAQVIEKLRLARPVVFEVVVDPPIEPYGKPWEIELLRRTSPSERPTDRIAGKISLEGTWKSPGIPPGTYELGILGDLGTRWHSESLEIEPGEPPLHVEIPVLRIKGTVSIGDEPLPATVWLGREGRSLRFDTDVDGSFEGLLPEEGTWRVELKSSDEGWRIFLEPVEIKMPPGKNLAEVKLEVPDTRLAGEVVDPSGRPVPGASVRFYSGPRKSSDDRTNKNGEFETLGLTPGPLVVSARSEMLESESILVQLADGVESP